MSSAIAPVRTIADEIRVWAMEQPEGRRYELVDGEVIGTVPERDAHAEARHRARRAPRQGIRATKVPCELFPDGMSGRVDTHTGFEPHALLRCGTPWDARAMEVSNPPIVWDVVSTPSRSRDPGSKPEGYSHAPSVRQRLIVALCDSAVINHADNACGDITTRIIREGAIRMGPRGVDVTGLF